MMELSDDVLAIRAELMRAVERDVQRRRRRRRALRTSGIAVTAALGLSGSALAAGAALGVIELGNGVHAEHVSGYPAYNVVTHQYVQVHGDYVYHLTGGKNDLSACPSNPNDIYVESSQPLGAAQLELAAEMASGAVKSIPPGAIPGLKSVSDGCGDAGVEATVDAGPHALGVKSPPRPVTLTPEAALKILSGQAHAASIPRRRRGGTHIASATRR